MKIKYTSVSSLRLDVFLSSKFPEVSRSQIIKKIDDSLITVNGSSVKSSYPLKTGDTVETASSTFQIPKPKKVNLKVIYQDDFCIVIDKPEGIITHAKGALTSEGSVASFIKPLIDNCMEGNRAGIVHRLDRGTSGVIIAAKTPQALIYLQRQFAKRQTLKRYIAVVGGEMDREEASINMPIERNPKRPSSFRVGANGKPAQTYYKVLASSSKYSTLLLEPKTGRTHQLRVHLKAIGHPIVGDIFYGGEPADRLMLHAYSLEVILPDKGRTKFISPVPELFYKYASLDLQDL